MWNKSERLYDMKINSKKSLLKSVVYLTLFVACTLLVQHVDVKPVGINGTDIGFSTVNVWFHSKTGTNMFLYNITDYLGLVPIFICVIFGLLGLTQGIKRKNIFKVDKILIVMGCYYVIVILCYLVFEIVPINYRPILINGKMESSYPSSTTLLVLSIIPTLKLYIDCKFNKHKFTQVISVLSMVFSCFMVFSRLICGVHWLTDIIGAILLSKGLFCCFKAVVLHYENKGIKNGI